MESAIGADFASLMTNISGGQSGHGGGTVLLPPLHLQRSLTLSTGSAPQCTKVLGKILCLTDPIVYLYSIDKFIKYIFDFVLVIAIN